MKYFITGGAGFIGSNMADRLLSEPDNEVVVYDNFSTGRREFLEEALKSDRFTHTKLKKYALKETWAI